MSDLKNLIYSVYAGTSDNIVAAFANNIDRDMYLDDLREAYPDAKQGHFDGSTIVPRITDINSDMYDALKFAIELSERPEKDIKSEAVLLHMILEAIDKVEGKDQ
jgi:hypothetical protein